MALRFSDPETERSSQEQIDLPEFRLFRIKYSNGMEIVQSAHCVDISTGSAVFMDRGSDGEYLYRRVVAPGQWIDIVEEHVPTTSTRAH